MYNKINPIDTGIKFVTVSGIVIDTNGTPLEGVNIYLKKDPLKGTTTNADGEFVLPSILGVLEIVFLYQGNEVILRANELNNKTITINTVSELPEAVVIGKKKKKLWPYLVGIATLGLIIKARSSNPATKTTL